MAKAKFTTNIDEDLLKKIKMKAIEEDRNVNEILENLLEDYLGIERPSEIVKVYIKSFNDSGLWTYRASFKEHDEWDPVDWDSIIYVKLDEGWEVAEDTDGMGVLVHGNNPLAWDIYYDGTSAYVENRKYRTIRYLKQVDTKEQLLVDKSNLENKIAKIEEQLEYLD